ncbi:MAG: carotenoid biosynthesis protein [Flavobacteriaceae bacterium]
MSLIAQFPLSKINLSLGLIWLFHISGALGIIYGNADWFIKATPINLMVSFLLLLLNTELKRKTLWVLFSCYVVGLFAEIIGVRYGVLFGKYHYGTTLGIHWQQVPLLIGVNWCLLVSICGAIASSFSNSLWKRAFIGTFLMLFLDLLIEPVAPVLDFWAFDEGIAGVHNYVGWALVAFPLQGLFAWINCKTDSKFSFHLYFLQSLFFILLMFRFYTLEGVSF